VIELALDQVVLRALADGGPGGDLVVEAGEDDDGQVRRGGVRAHDRLQAARVRERQIEQDEVERAALQRREPVGEPGHVLPLDLHRARLAEHLLEEPRVARVILDDEDAKSLAHGVHSGGSSTTDSQKPSMDLTTWMNCSRSTGLVT
jgi:hypothetical protein